MSRVELVGILNLTPDSFSEDGFNNAPQAALDHAEELFNTGATYVDVGAESTRPGATRLIASEEWARLEPVLPELIRNYPDHISLDTYHPETVERAAEAAGRFIINDVTGFNNQGMVQVAAELGLTCIVSHLPESAGMDIQAAHREKSVDSINQVHEELMVKLAKLMNAGLYKDQIILDPGIGFGKTPELNWQLLEFARLTPDVDVMIGYSRKRFLGENRMEIGPNLEAGQIAVAAGTRFLRVHDVAGHLPLTKTT